MIRAIGLCTMLGASPVFGDVPARIEAAFLDWAENNGVTKAVLAVSHQGVLQGDFTLNTKPETPVELASLSKAITAACAATLIEAGIWTRETSSAEVLKFGPEGISVAQLLTHQSGLGPDQTQSAMQIWFGDRTSQARDGATTALSRPMQSGQAGVYSYNNENYAILGEMIATQTGHSYESYCTEKVLKPAGVMTAEPSPLTGAFLPFGGWQMTMHDYARFHWHEFGPKGRIGAEVSNWPQAKIKGSMTYGMGMVQRPFAGRYNFWHFGGLCFPGRLNTGAYAVMWMDEWSVVAGYDICATGTQMFALDHALKGAVFQ